MTYRVGNHHEVTIVSEGDGARCGREDHDCRRGHLVAVLVDGDQALAERICQLLNGPPYPARCTLEPGVRGCVCQPWPDCAVAERVDPPSARTSSPRSAQEGPGIPGSGSDGSEAAQTISVGVECKLVRPAGPGPTEPCACRPSQPCALGTVI